MPVQVAERLVAVERAVHASVIVYLLRGATDRVDLDRNILRREAQP
jgi:hypothetical protein